MLRIIEALQKYNPLIEKWSHFVRKSYFASSFSIIKLSWIDGLVVSSFDHLNTNKHFGQLRLGQGQKMLLELPYFLWDAWLVWSIGCNQEKMQYLIIQRSLLRCRNKKNDWTCQQTHRYGRETINSRRTTIQVGPGHSQNVKLIFSWLPKAFSTEGHRQSFAHA